MIFTVCKRSLGQGNVLTPVRQSFCSGCVCVCVCVMTSLPVMNSTSPSPPPGQHPPPGRHPPKQHPPMDSTYPMYSIPLLDSTHPPPGQLNSTPTPSPIPPNTWTAPTRTQNSTPPPPQAGGTHTTAMLSYMGFHLSFVFFLEACISLVGTLCTLESL